ncbi:MAG: response regulator [Clostridiales bacterium]|nr:response regulator [Clostridiales bacterium]
MELLKLVIVDDEPIQLEGLCRTYDWEKMGFTVAGSASGGAEAIGIIKEIRPHVVLTDIRMKQITGLMVMEEIKKAGIDCIFIVLSAYRDFEYAQSALQLGAFDYLLKPIEDEKLFATMRRAHGACMELASRLTDYRSDEGDASSAQAADAACSMLGGGEHEEGSEPAPRKEYLQAAAAYIDEHLACEDLSIVSVAAYVYLNPAYFGRVFKTAFGMTFKQYLLSRRMERARTLLKSGDVSIGSICEQVGIGDASYFSRLFKEYTGMLPSEYKKR